MAILQTTILLEASYRKSAFSKGTQYLQFRQIVSSWHHNNEVKVMESISSRSFPFAV